MARWASKDLWPGDLPRPGDPGWRTAALAWLREHPGQRLPFGDFGDATEVYQMCRELRLTAS